MIRRPWIRHNELITKMSEKLDLEEAVIDFNRNYLSFANRLIRNDRKNGQRMLGLSEQMTSLIAKLTPQQIETLAKNNELICGFRADDMSIFSSIAH